MFYVNVKKALSFQSRQQEQEQEQWEGTGTLILWPPGK